MGNLFIGAEGFSDTSGSKKSFAILFFLLRRYNFKVGVLIAVDKFMLRVCLIKKAKEFLFNKSLLDRKAFILTVKLFD